MSFPAHPFLFLALFASPLAAAPMPGNAPGQEAALQEAGLQESSTQEGEISKARTHVLHLANGQVFRGRARTNAGVWEIWENRAWRPLPEHSVERGIAERELMKRARKLERELPKSSDPGADTKRAAYADWLLREGLHKEGFAELERLLRIDPDQADARRILAASPVQLAVPKLEGAGEKELDAFLRAAAGTSALQRETLLTDLERRVVHRDGTRADASHSPSALQRALQRALQQDLESSSPRRRSFATHALRRLFPIEDARPFLTRALLDPSDDVRTGASRALRDIGDEGLVVPVLRALGSKNERVREHAIQALGTMGYPAAVAPLYNHLTTTLQSARGGSGGAPRSNIFVGRQIAYVQDFDVEVAQAQSIADPVINVLAEGNSLEAAVLGVSEYVVASERAATRRTLARLTGATPGNTTAAWKRWWKENGDEWTQGNPPSSPSSPTSPGK